MSREWGASIGECEEGCPRPPAAGLEPCFGLPVEVDCVAWRLCERARQDCGSGILPLCQRRDARFFNGNYRMRRGPVLIENASRSP